MINSRVISSPIVTGMPLMLNLWLRELSKEKIQN